MLNAHIECCSEIQYRVRADGQYRSILHLLQQENEHFLLGQRQSIPFGAPEG